MELEINSHWSRVWIVVSHRKSACGDRKPGLLMYLGKPALKLQGVKLSDPGTTDLLCEGVHKARLANTSIAKLVRIDYVT